MTANVKTRWAIGTIIAVLVILLTVLYTVDTYLVRRSAVNIVTTVRPIPYVLAVCSIMTVYLSVGVTKFRLFFVIASAVLLSFFVMSLETLAVHAASGEIYEGWPWANLYAGSISVEEPQYCYRRQILSIKLQPIKSGSQIALRDGLWPANISDQSIQKAFAGWLRPCAGS